MKHSKIPLFCCSLFMLMQSCVTDKYDFRKDLDVEFSFSPDGFCLPGENSADIPLSQLISLNDSSELCVDSLGNYVFYKKGNDLDTTIVCVGQGSLCGATEDTLSFLLNDNPNVTITPNKRFPEYGKLEFVESVSPSYDPDYVESSIRELTYLRTHQTIDIALGFDNLDGVIYGFDTIRYILPSFYTVTNPKELVETNVTVDGYHSHSIRISGVDFTGKDLKEGEGIGIDEKSRKLIFKGKVGVKGVVKSINIDELNAHKNSSIDMRVMIGTMGTTEVTGRFSKKEDVDLEPIYFDNLPDFINDDEVVIDVENPIVRMTLNSEVPADVMLNAVMTGMKNEKAISEIKAGNDYGTQNIMFQGPEFGTGEMKRTNIWISRVPTEIPDSVQSNVVIPEVMNLMKKIPEKVVIDAYARIDSTKQFTLSLAKEYKAIPQYEVYVPLKMGPSMKIVYKKDLENLQKSLKYANISKLCVKAKATNNIPLDLMFEVKVYDKEGNELKGVEIIKPEKIAAFETCDIDFYINNSLADNQIKMIDRIALKFYAESSEKLAGQMLNKNQNLRLENVKITLRSEE